MYSKDCKLTIYEVIKKVKRQSSKIIYINNKQLKNTQKHVKYEVENSKLGGGGLSKNAELLQCI